MQNYDVSFYWGWDCHGLPIEVKVEQEYNKLITDEHYVSQYAREKYWMKKDNEDLYIVVEQ